MTTDFRALCAELADALHNAIRVIHHEDGTLHISTAEPVLARARAALAEPGSQAEMLAVRPMMEKIAAMGDCIGQQTVGQIMAISQRAAAWLAENPPGQPVAIEPRGCPTPGACSCVMPSTSAALAEPEPEGPTQPIAVSERLPGPEDCDAEGRCWLHGKVEGDWRLINVANPGVPKLSYCFSHWLPAHALPLPTIESD